jgi:hypothetical protein
MITAGWYAIEFYTYMMMCFTNLWNTYLEFRGNDDDDKCETYPFTLVEKDGYYQIYYPSFTVADFTFIQTQVEVDGQKYDVEVKPYMVDGNRLFTSEFVSYIMEYDHNIDVDQESDYKVFIMDHNVDVVTLDNKDHIEIYKDNYLKKSRSD